MPARTRILALLCRCGLIIASLVPTLGTGAAGKADSCLIRENEDVSAVTGIDLEKLVARQRYTGPLAVWLYNSKSSQLEEGSSAASLETVKEIAQQFGGMVRFASMDCGTWSSMCLDLNVRRTPAVILYPLHPAPPQLHYARLKKLELTAKISQLLEDAGRAVAVQPQEAEVFMTQTTRPLKALLLSSRKSMPVTLQALSNEPDLRWKVLFGFIAHGDGALSRHFGVMELPAFVVQCGKDITTREAHYPSGGNHTFAQLRAWLLSITCLAEGMPHSTREFSALSAHFRDLDDYQKTSDTGSYGSWSQCCLCRDGVISWSISGTCTQCKGELQRTLRAPEGCTLGPKSEKGRMACLGLCQELFESEGRGPVDSPGPLRPDPSLVHGSKCCLCRTGVMSWSSSGSCSHCHGMVERRLAPPSGCVAGRGFFRGEEACARDCAGLLAQLVVDLGRNASSESDGHRDAAAATAAGSKCCLCRNGKVSWSATGSCSHCHGEVERRSLPPAGCVIGELPFNGSKACVRKCREALDTISSNVQ